MNGVPARRPSRRRARTHARRGSRGTRRRPSRRSPRTQSGGYTSSESRGRSILNKEREAKRLRIVVTLAVLPDGKF